MTNSDPAQPDGGGWLTRSNAIATLAGAMIATFITASTGLSNLVFSWANQATTHQGVVIANLSAEDQRNQAARKAHDEHVMTVYREATDALDKHDTARQMLALALSRILLRDPGDSEIAASIATIIHDNSKSPSVVAAAADARFVAEQGAPALPTPVAAAVPNSPAGKPLAGYNVDAFWCDGASDKAREAVESLVGALNGMGTVRVRSRILPADRNAQPGYQVEGIQVRYEAPSETGAAEQIMRAIGPAVRAAGLLDTPVLHAVANKTPGYISVFVCPKA